MEPSTTVSRKATNYVNLAIHVSPEELDLAAAVFCFVHRECGAAYACQKGNAVKLRCELCGESRVYEVSEPNFSPSVEMRPLFRKPAETGRKPFFRRMAF